MDDSYDIKATLAGLVSGACLDEAQAEGLFEALLTGTLDEAQIGAVVALIQSRRASVDEIVGAARAMRRHVTPVPARTRPGEVLLDTCGTGGAAKTFNISTATAFVVTAAEPVPGSGVKRILVAKHGNRSRTGRGSAEVLAGLGVDIEAEPATQAKCLETAGVCFSFAMRHHPAMRHAAGPRRSLGFPTIFNLLGPLTNPAGAGHQLLGVYHPELVEPIAQALNRLGSVHAAVVHGAGGLDECSTLGPTLVSWVRAEGVRSEEIDPAAVGLSPCRIEAIEAHDLDQAIVMIRGVLDGDPGPCREIVVLNAAVALMTAGAAGTLQEGRHRAEAAIDSGRARGALEALVECSRG